MEMKKIYAQISLGELTDKISILEIKKKKIVNKNHLKFINKEHHLLQSTLSRYYKKSTRYKKLKNRLKKVNLCIWEYENQKRQIQKHLEKFILVSKNVYKYNDLRSKLKNKIDKINRSDFLEIKQYAKY